MTAATTSTMPKTQFAHQHAAHCESGAVSSLLRHYGCEISEAMTFGLSSALLFAHFPFIKVEGFPLTAYRAMPGTIIKSVESTLGAKMRRERFRNKQQGMDRLDELLAQGHAVGLQASVYWLPYFPPDMRFHFNAHNLVAYGKREQEYLISDPVSEFTVTCASEDLARARFVKGMFAPRGLIYYPSEIPTQIDYARAIGRAIRRTSFQMLKTPVPFVGVRAIRYLADRIANIESRNADPRYARLYIAMIVRMQEEIGTGGGGFRFIYASFLQEAGRLLNDARFAEASDSMTQAGDAWRDFALLGARFCKKKTEINTQQLADAVRRCADFEDSAFRRLRDIRL
jgi:hypothetical protein